MGLSIEREKVISEFEDFVKSFSKRDDTYYKGLFVSVLTLLKEQGKKKFFVDSDGKITPLPDIVRCKECIHRGKAEKCVLAAIAAEKDFPLFMLDNRGEWYCADGKREAEEEKTERNEENVR